MAKSTTQKTESARKFKEVSESEFFKFENQGDSISGTLDRIEPIEIDDKPVNKYHLTDESGNKYTFLGGAKLDVLLPELIGQFVRITFKETQALKGGRRMKAYIVEVSE